MAKMNYHSWDKSNEDLFFGICLFFINKKGYSVSNAIKAIRKLNEFKCRSFHSLRSKYYEMRKSITEEYELGNYLDLGIQYMFTNNLYPRDVQYIEVQKEYSISKSIVSKVINKLKNLFK